MNWPKSLKIKRKFSLKKHTSMKVGGKAEFYLEPDNLSDLRSALRIANRNKLKVRILGAGSNLLISDKGVKGLTVRLNSPFFSRVEADNVFINAGSGSSLAKLIKISCNSGLSGLEFLSGIPASLGGALIMNAGCWGKEISSLVCDLSVMDYDGNIENIKPSAADFSYRASGLSKYIILKAKLKLRKENKKRIRELIKSYAVKKLETQDLTFPSAGCIFKNPKGKSAGRLIDECGFKGKRLGGALVSPKHANFILNYHKASASDVLALMNTVKKEVRRKFGINLCPEVKIWR